MGERIMPANVSAAEERNLASIIRGIDRMLNTGDFSTAHTSWAPDIIFHSPSGTTTHTLDEMVAELEMAHHAFPDLHLEIHEMLANGDYAAVRYTLSGTHKGEFNGIPPTNRRFAVSEQIFYRFDEDGLLREMWPNIDFLALMQQIGVMPPGPPPKILLKLIALQQRFGRPKRK